MKYFLSVILLLQCQQFITGSSDETIESNTENEPLTRVRRGGLSMLRLGRGLQMLRLGKRGMPMLRMGRSSSELNYDDLLYLLDTILQGKFNNRREVLESLRRQAPLPRYGRDQDGIQEPISDEDMNFRNLLQGVLSQRFSGQRPNLFTFIEPSEETPRQIRLAPRPGRVRRSVDDKDVVIKDDDESNEVELSPAEKSLPLPRFGREKELEDVFNLDGYTFVPIKLSTDEKRAMHMLRLGRGMHMLRLGKRAMKMLRLGRSEIPQEENETDDKRSLSMLRLGKRLRMLRLGKRNDIENVKRPLNMMRLGKKDDDDMESEHNVDTRAMHMLRLGRSAQ